jgi:predicted RNA binding protein YcfA (HicA-like mRNA interferase family)
MGRIEKLLERLRHNPKDFTFDEMKNVLESLGFTLSEKGKTSGSRVKFLRGNVSIILHKPHPRKELLEYQIKQIIRVLVKEDLL